MASSSGICRSLRRSLSSSAPADQTTSTSRNTNKRPIKTNHQIPELPEESLGYDPISNWVQSSQTRPTEPTTVPTSSSSNINKEQRTATPATSSAMSSAKAEDMPVPPTGSVTHHNKHVFHYDPKHSTTQPGTFARHRFKTFANASTQTQIGTSWTCTSSKLIFAVICTKAQCDVNKTLFVGETTPCLGDRFVEELRDVSVHILRDKPDIIRRHYHAIPHSPTDIKVVGLKPQ